MTLLAKPDTYHIDTSNVLFILSGAFVGLDNIVKRRVARGVRTQIHSYTVGKRINGCYEQSIGFTANLPQPEENNSKESMQFFTPNRKVSQNILDLVEPAGRHLIRTHNPTRRTHHFPSHIDLVKYGYIQNFPRSALTNSITAFIAASSQNSYPASHR